MNVRLSDMAMNMNDELSDGWIDYLDTVYYPDLDGRREENSGRDLCVPALSEPLERGAESEPYSHEEAAIRRKEWNEN